MVVLCPKMKAPTTIVTTPQMVKMSLRWQTKLNKSEERRGEQLSLTKGAVLGILQARFIA